MRLSFDLTASSQVAEVTLSRRNLLTLLSHLDHRGRKRRIETYADCPEGWMLAVTAEEDEEHYGGRPAPSGPMRPGSEEDISEPGDPPANEEVASELQWRAVDRELARGELEVDRARQKLHDLGLVHLSVSFRVRRGDGVSWMLEPDWDRLVSGPRVLLDHGQGLFGGPRIYMPVRPTLSGPLRELSEPEAER